MLISLVIMKNVYLTLILIYTMASLTNIPKFTIDYIADKPVNLNNLAKNEKITKGCDIDAGYIPFNITQYQSYNPIYNIWFSLDENNFNSITLNNKYHIKTMDTVIESSTNTETNKEVFIKYSPLLDPLRYMGGKYESIRPTILNLPTLKNENVCDKIKDNNNMAYVDCFFSYLSSQLLNENNIVHGIDYFGSFLGIQENFKMDITDDYEYLLSSSFFNNNIDKLFNLSFSMDNEYNNFGSRANKKPLSFISNDDSINLEIDVLDDLIIVNSENNNVNDNENTIVYSKPSNINSHNSTASSSNTTDSDDSDVSNSSIDSNEINNTGDDDEWETEDEDESECDTYSSMEECSKYAYINNFPVQSIALEKCSGTLDDLFENNILELDSGLSALMQINMILLIYQHAFQFTHNDLHTNNIMYINTDVEYLYYKYNNISYRVPTFGRIYKLIDFGRAIYKYNGQRLCSDSFGPNGDAFTQYNCEPYINMDKARLEPNYSFDLCRLGCSLYDFVIDDDIDRTEYDDLQNLVYEWCLDDNNKNILYKKNGDERYPNFKLYKMIARTVHNKTPEDQLNRNIFKKYICNDITDITNIMNIDQLPQYYTKYQDRHD